MIYADPQIKFNQYDGDLSPIIWNPPSDLFHPWESMVTYSNDY